MLSCLRLIYTEPFNFICVFKKQKKKRQIWLRILIISAFDIFNNRNVALLYYVV